MKITIHRLHFVARWSWNLSPDSCSICRSPFDGCCPTCEFPGDDCAPIFGKCKHSFHLHCHPEGTQITLSDGSNVPIESVKKGQSVLGFLKFPPSAPSPSPSTEDEGKSPSPSGGIVPSKVLGVLPLGFSECFELTFCDGRTVKCTADHRLLTSEGQWREAGSLLVGKEKIQIALQGNSRIPDSPKDSSPPLDFSFSFGPLSFCFPSAVCGDSDENERQKMRSLFRLMGKILSDGEIHNNQCILFASHPLDVMGILTDCRVVGGETPTVEKAEIHSENDKSKGKNIFSIFIPQGIFRDLQLLDECFHISTLSSSSLSRPFRFPSVLSHPHIPPSCVSEFLSAVLGGAVTSPMPIFSEPSLMDNTHEKSLIDFSPPTVRLPLDAEGVKEFSRLFEMCGVKWTPNSATLTEFDIPQSIIPSLLSSIGIRYNALSAIRFHASSTVQKFRIFCSEIREILIGRMVAKMEKSKMFTEFQSNPSQSKFPPPLRQLCFSALSAVKKEFPVNSPSFPIDVLSPSIDEFEDFVLRGKEIQSVNIDMDAFVRDSGIHRIFDDTEDSPENSFPSDHLEGNFMSNPSEILRSEEGRKKIMETLPTYSPSPSPSAHPSSSSPPLSSPSPPVVHSPHVCVDRSSFVLPTLSLLVISRRSIGPLPVFDLTIESPIHSFVADSVVSHNCILKWISQQNSQGDGSQQEVCPLCRQPWEFR